MADDVAEVLHRSPFCSRLTRAERLRLASIATIRRVAAGEELVREGDETTELGIINTGRVALRLRVPERGAMTVLTVEPGDVYGWSAVVAPHRSTSTIVAVEDTEAVVFEAARLRELLFEDEPLAAALYPCLLRVIARRLEATRLQLLDLFAGAEVHAW
jgi:CRP/FNR family cyclic AMP-dependent transcriptional regulator